MHAAFALLLGAGGAHAVIVAGANGGAGSGGNTTRVPLETAVGRDFPLFDNVIAYSDATGVYLGYNPSTYDVWVLTARHVGPSSAAITLSGNSYTWQQRINLSGDLALVRYTQADNIMPTLSHSPLAASLPDPADDLVMFGIGRERVQAGATTADTPDSITLMAGPPAVEGYQWAATRVRRWGLNNMDEDFIGEAPGFGPLNSISFGSYSSWTYSATFDRPADDGWLASNEAMGSRGDSGGGVFYWDGGQWVLSGIMSAIATYTGQPASTSAFGNATAITDISTYRNEILSFTGALIPEPSAALLLCIASMLALRRRRRDC